MLYLSEVIARENAIFGGNLAVPGFILNKTYVLMVRSPLLCSWLRWKKQEKAFPEFVNEAPEYFTLRENIACKNEEV